MNNNLLNEAEIEILYIFYCMYILKPKALPYHHFMNNWITLVVIDII